MKKTSERKNSKIWIVIGSIIIILIIMGLLVYNLQFTIFKSLYESSNNIAKQVYSINKNNDKFKKNIDKMFSEKLNKNLNKYKNNEITFEQLESEINKFVEYKDCSNKIKEVKQQKEKYEEAKKYCEEKDYKKALPIYIELNNNYADLTEEITVTKSELKKIILEQVNKLKGENNYSEAIKVIEEIKDFYKEDEEISKLLSEISKLKQNKEKEEKEKQKIEEIKSSVKVTKVWTDTPNSAGGVDLYINWKNLSDKVIKYAYFTVVPYNSVNDIVTCTIRDYADFQAQADNGPYSKGQGNTGTGYYWENAWYNHSIKGAKLKSVRIIYMDGTTLDIPEKYIEYIK